MDDWGKFNETSLPKKETFYGHLNMEDIADADYAHFKRENFFFQIRRTSWFLCSKQNNTVNWCIWELSRYVSWYMSSFSFSAWISMTSSFKKLDLLTDIDMLLIVEKGIKRQNMSLFINVQTLITNTWKIVIKIKIRQNWDVNNFHGSAMSLKLSVNNFKWVQDIFKSEESYDEESDQGFFIKTDIQCPEKLHNLHNDLPLLPEQIKTKKLHRIIKFKQTAWLTLFIYMNTDLRKKSKK